MVATPILGLNGCLEKVAAVVGDEVGGIFSGWEASDSEVDVLVGSVEMGSSLGRHKPGLVAVEGQSDLGGDPTQRVQVLSC